MTREQPAGFQRRYATDALAVIDNAAHIVDNRGFLKALAGRDVDEVVALFRGKQPFYLRKR